MKRLIFVILLMAVGLISSLIVQAIGERFETPIVVEPITEMLYLDTTLVPDGYDNDMLIRLYDFLQQHIVPNIRTPYAMDYINTLPVIVRYVPFSEDGTFPDTTGGFGGWCDVVLVECLDMLHGDCDIALPQAQDINATPAFLALVAIPADDNPDYMAELWGLTAHELAHTMGAIDGPRCPVYEEDKLLAPTLEVSDTYYWFGIASLFEQRWKGVIWDAWQDTCRDEICTALRTDVFYLER